MARSWEDVITERKKKKNGSQYAGDEKAQSRNISVLDEPWQEVLAKRGADPYQYMDPYEKKEYNRPYHSFRLDQEQNQAKQKLYDTMARPAAPLNHKQSFTPKPTRPVENATLTNIPTSPQKIKDTFKTQQPINPLPINPIKTQQIKDTFKTQPIYREPVAQDMASQLKSMTPQQRMTEFEYQTGAKRPQVDPKNAHELVGKYPYAPYNQGELTATPELVQKDINLKRGIKDKTKAFLHGLANPIAKPIQRFFDDGMKDENGLYPNDGSSYKRTYNWYVENEMKLLEKGYNKKDIKTMRKQDLKAARLEDERLQFNAAMGKRRDYQPTTGDEIAKMGGEVTSTLAQALAMGAGMGAAGITGIKGAALVGAGTEAVSSYGDRDDIMTAAKDVARNALFYGAGKYGSDKVGAVAGELITKYGLDTNAAMLYATEAVKGLAFDATGYAATLPTYPLTGDAMPTGKEIAFDMAVGALFDIIPNALDVKPTLAANRKQIEANQVRMKVALEHMQQTYEAVGKYEKYAPQDRKTLDAMYEAMLNDIDYIKSGINGSTIKGQKETIDKLNELFSITEQHIAYKRSQMDIGPNKRAAGQGEAPNRRLNYEEPQIEPEYPPLEEIVQNVSNTHKQLIEEHKPLTEPRPPIPRPQPSEKPIQYGTSGNKAFKKWGTNEWVNADLNNMDNPYTQDYKRFFETWYEAGRLGIPTYMVRYEGKSDFPPFLELAFYEAGKNDMAKGTPKQGTGLPKPKTQESLNPITVPLKNEEEIEVPTAPPISEIETSKEPKYNKELYEKTKESIEQQITKGHIQIDHNKLKNWIERHDPTAEEIHLEISKALNGMKDKYLKDSYKFGSGVTKADKEAVDKAFKEINVAAIKTLKKNYHVFDGETFWSSYDVGNEIIFYRGAKHKEKRAKGRIVGLPIKGYADVDVDGTVERIRVQNILEIDTHSDLDASLGIKKEIDPLKDLLGTYDEPKEPKHNTNLYEQMDKEFERGYIPFDHEALKKFIKNKKPSAMEIRNKIGSILSEKTSTYWKDRYTFEKGIKKTDIEAANKAIDKHYGKMKEALAKQYEVNEDGSEMVNVGDEIIYYQPGGKEKRVTAKVIRVGDTGVSLDIDGKFVLGDFDNILENLTTRRKTEQSSIDRVEDRKEQVKKNLEAEEAATKEVVEMTREEYETLKTSYDEAGIPLPEDIEVKIVEPEAEQEAAPTLEDKKTLEAYEKETKKLLGSNQEAVYNYLREMKKGKKAATYYMSPELAGVDGINSLKAFIKFNFDKTSAKLDTMQMEMANEFPEVGELGLEEFAQYLVDSVKYHRETRKTKNTEQETKRDLLEIEKEPTVNPLNKDYKTYKAMYDQHKEAIMSSLSKNKSLVRKLEANLQTNDYHSAAIEAIMPVLDGLKKYAPNYLLNGDVKSDEFKMHNYVFDDLKNNHSIIDSIIKGEVGNEQVEQIRNDGERPLEAVPTQDVPGTKEAGETEPGATKRTGENERRNGGADRPGPRVRPGMGDSEGEVHSTTTRESEVKADEEIATKKEQTLEQPKGKNHVITEDLDIAKSEQGKYEDNVAAIRLVKQLEQEGRYATPEEQKVLAKYIGWGGLSKAFSNDDRWGLQNSTLKELLTKEEYNAASASTRTAFYTPIEVVQTIYHVMENLGFKGGRVLEPSAGVGNFLGAAPGTNKIHFTAVELDKITGTIAKYLYPQANIQVKGYQKAAIPDNYYDMAIGNVPFGDVGVYDEKYAKAPKEITNLIHNYFFAKSIDKVRVGGLVAFITSKGTLDAEGTVFRRYMAERADLIGAVRLPNNTFKGDAGTSVVSDLLIFKKREPGTPYNGIPFIETKKMEIPYENRGYKANVMVNEVFTDNPGMILGNLIYSSNRYGYDLDVKPIDGEILPNQILKALGGIEAKMDYPVKPIQEVNEAIRSEIAAPIGKYKENAYVVGEDGTLYRNNKGQLIPYQAKNKGEETRIKGMIEVKNAAAKVRRLQLDNATEEEKNKARKELNRVYDKFVKELGYVNSQTNRRAFIDDPDFTFLASIEKYDKEAKTGTKGDIFSKDVIAPIKVITHVETSKEALIVSLNESGNVDMKRMEQLTGKKEKELIKELTKDKLIFKTPEGNYEIAERYLSGNVRVKLEQAEALALMDKSYERNVEALKEVQPKDLTAGEINPQIGQIWIPNEYYSQFLGHLFDLDSNNFEVHYERVTGSYKIDYKGRIRIRSTPQALSKWGIAHKNGWDIVEAAFNNKDVKCTTKVDGKEVVLVEETAIAKQKLQAVKQEFKRWLFSDKKRAEKLVSLYNYTQNNIALPKYNGQHLDVIGMNPLKKLRPHQADAVWRVISSGGNTLLAHKVGAGKSGEMAAAAMALRQMGIVKKPMFVVPKHLVNQWGEEFLSFFPAANILVAGEKDFKAENRKILVNRISTGDWDAVIVADSSFKQITMSEETTTAFFEEQLEELRRAKEEAAYREGKTANVKDIERSIAALETKLEKKLAAIGSDKDNTPFEELGVDSLFVDEAHLYKNLLYSTHMTNVSGLGSKEGSDRAFDMYMKIRYLQQLNGGKGIVFATATPVMNSMSEMYIMQKYLQGDLLRERGLDNFDAWANMFGEVITVMEMTPEGRGYREKQSFSKFKNVGELMQMFKSFSDVLTHVEGLKIPKMRGGKPQVVICKPSKEQLRYIEELAARAEAVRGRNVDPQEDNMLKITGDGRKLALDQRLVNSEFPEDPGSKANVVSDKVYDIWEATKKQKSAQLVFCDMGIPKGEDKKKTTEKDGENEEAAEDQDNVSIYNDIKAKLLLRGIPAKEIAFIHEANTDAKKLALFDKVNKGEVRVLIGSTAKMGVGMNAQKKLIALHHMDPPWRPGDIEQRDGRILRQGNENEEVDVFHYVTERTFDARMWDNLFIKKQFIDTAMNSGTGIREMQDVSEEALSFADIKAIASGNPLIKEHNKLMLDLKSLELAKVGHEDNKFSIMQKISRKEEEIKYFESRKNILSGYLEVAANFDVKGDNFTLTFDGKTYRDKKEAGKAILEAITAMKKSKIKDGEVNGVSGEIAGIPIAVTRTGAVFYMGEEVEITQNRIEKPELIVQSLITKINIAPDRVEKLDTSIKDGEKFIESLKQELDTPFEREAELAQVKARYEEVTAILKQEANQVRQNQESEGDTTEEVDYDDIDAFYSNLTSVKGQPHTTLGKATGENKDVEGTKSASQIFKVFEKQFGAAIKNNPKRGTLGTYNRREHLIRIKKTNDLPTLTHEVGHLLDRTYEWSDGHNKSYAKELTRLGEPASRKSYTPKQVRKEGVAEFVRLYFTEPEVAKESPFYEHFVSDMSSKELQAVEKLQHEIWKLINLSAVDRVSKSIKFIDEDMLLVRAGKKIAHAAEAFDLEAVTRGIASELWDENYNIYWAAGEMGGPGAKEQLENKVAAYRGFEGEALFSIDPKNEGGYQTNLKGEKVGRSYNAIMKPVHKNKKIRKEFMAYQVAMRAIDYNERKMEMPDDFETYLTTIKTLEAKYPYFEEVFNELLEYRKNNLYQLVEGGLMSVKEYKDILEENPHYVPLKRDFDNYNAIAGSGTKMAASKNVIKRVKGSGRDIIDPEKNDIISTFLYKSAAKRNAILLKLAAIEETAKDAGYIMSRAKIPMQVIELEMQQLEKIINEVIEKNDLPQMENMNLNVMNKIFKPNYIAKENQVVIYDQGKVKLYDIHPDLYKTFARFNVNQANFIIDIMSTIGKISKMGTILTPTYVYRNFSRDTQQSMIGSEAGIHLGDIAAGLWSTIRNDENYKEFKKYGGGVNYFTSTDENFIRRTVKDMQMQHKNVPTKMLHRSVHFLRLIQDIIEPLENAPRVAEYKKMRKLLKDAGNSEKAIEKAIAKARDLSVDFKRMGALIRRLHINKLYNYSNPAIQGVAKDIRLLTNKRTRMRTIIRSILYITMPTVLMWLVNKDNENYKELPVWQKDLFLNIPIPIDWDFRKAELFIPIPRTQGLGMLFGGVVEHLLENSFNENPRAFDGMAENMMQIWGMSPVPSAIAPFYEAKTNENFLGNPIINMGDANLPGYLQFNQYTSETAKAITKLTKWLPLEEVHPLKSAKKMDHMLRQYGGTWAKVGLGAIDKAAGKERVALEPILTGFVVDSKRRPESMNKFYEYKEKLDYAYAETMLTKQITKLYDPGLRELFKDTNTLLTEIREAKQAIEHSKNGIGKEKILRELEERELAAVKYATQLFEEKYR